MSLDTRARHAVRSLQEGVVRVTPVALPLVTRRQRRASLVVGIVGAACVVFASLALASMLPDGDPSDVATVTTVPTGIVPDPETPDGIPAVLPEGDPGFALGVFQKNPTSTSPSPWTQFYGTAEPGAVVAASSEYGSARLTVGESGEFSLKVEFEGAPLGIPFPVLLTVGDTTYDFKFTSLWDPANVAVSVHQTYGSSSAANPFEKFFGTAPPGTAIEVTSAYGSADTESWDSGDWYVKVWFTGAPIGEPFAVVVTIDGEPHEFEFVWNFAEITEVTVTQEGTSSSSSSPYTRFVGTAPAGTHLLATSQYGSADVTVGETGEFSFKVWFSGAPSGVKFPITFKVDHEAYETFYFTWTQQAPTGISITQYNTESWDAYPWIKFHGTAPAGTALVALSPYGNASGTVDGSGEVYFKLYFSTLPPANEPFTVTLKVNGSVYGTYQFVSHYSGEMETTVTPYITESDSPTPYAKVDYWAPAGTTIELVSAYGSASVTAGWTGNGHLKLFFSTLPPAGEPFPVTIKVNGETYGSFTFTSWYDPAGVEKWATYSFGSCNLNPPYDVYYGTAPAGTVITITSPYSGPVQVTAGAGGTWEKKVYFSGAPLNQQFTVTVDVGGTVFTFGMTVTSA